MEVPVIPPGQLEKMEADNHNAFVKVTVEHIILGVAAIIAVVLRFNARRITKSALKWDDWLSIAACALLWGDNVLAMLEMSPSFKKPLPMMTLDDVSRLMLFNYVSIYFVSFCQVAARLSLILLYYRLFSVKRGLSYALKAIAILSLAWLATMTLGTTFSCIPVRAAYTVGVPGNCVDPQLVYIATQSIDTGFDAIVLSLPIPTIMKLSLPMRERAGIACIFLIGGLVIITGLLRIVAAASMSGVNDIQALVRTSIWNGLHLSFATICCCLPVFRVYLHKNEQVGSAFQMLYKNVSKLARITSRTSRRSSEEEEKSDVPPLPSFVDRRLDMGKGWK